MGIGKTGWRQNAACQWLAAALVLCFVAGYWGVEPMRLHRQFFYIALAVTVFIAASLSDWRKMVQQPLCCMIGLYIAYQAASLGWSQSCNMEELGEVLRKGALTLGFLFLVQRLWHSAEALALFWRGLAWVAGIMAAMALWRYGVAMPEDGRLMAIGRSENAVQAGVLCGIGAVIIAAMGLAFPLQGSKSTVMGERIALCLLWGACIAALLLTQSRGAWLGAIAAHGVLLIGQSRRIRWPIGLMGGAVLLAALALSSLWVDWATIIARADGFRLMIWQYALQQWQTAPLTGLGYRTPFAFTLPYGQTIYQPHSLYIGALYYGGVCGLAVLLALFGKTAWQLMRYKNQPYALLALGLLVNGMVLALVDFDLLLVNSGLEWLLFWLPVAAALGIGSTAPYGANDEESKLLHDASAA